MYDCNRWPLQEIKPTNPGSRPLAWRASAGGAVYASLGEKEGSRDSPSGRAQGKMAAQLRTFTVLAPLRGGPKNLLNLHVSERHRKAVAMGPGAPLGRPLAATCLKKYRFWDDFGSLLAPLGRHWFHPFIKGRKTRFYWKNQ